MSNNSNQHPKLTKRLTRLLDMIKPNAYQVIWDGCCDHGYLGEALLSSNYTEQVIFVDIVPEITRNLSIRLAKYSSDSFQVLTKSMTEIEPEQQLRHLIVLAGIGGDLSIEILKELSQKYGGYCDFLLCSVNRNFQLRRFLSSNGLLITEESFITENGRYYELMMTTQLIEPEIKASPVGNFWDGKNSHHANYLKKLLNHYSHYKNQDTLESEAFFEYKKLESEVFKDNL